MTALIAADRLSRRYVVGGVFNRGQPVLAVNNVSLSIERGETVGLVGESGSGKSTLGRLLLGLLPPNEGRICFDGIDVVRASAAQRLQLRRRMQIVFQNPESSLDPSRSVGAQIADGLTIHHIVPEAKQRERVDELLAEVGLPPAYSDRYPHQLSGGQQQRVGIARALATGPEFLVADDPVSALDVSEQAQVLDLLANIRARHALALLFISSTLAEVVGLCERVVVIYLGQIMEDGPVSRVFGAPRHPYTHALLSAAPSLDQARRRTRTLLQGEPPSLTDRPSGCVFRTRCPISIPACATAVPPLTDGVACIRADQAA